MDLKALEQGVQLFIGPIVKNRINKTQFDLKM